MKCPFCSHDDSKVMDKRETPDGKSTRRRRECLKCGKRFTTYERIETTDIMVVKKDNRREAFDREKIRRGVLKACEKRPVSSEQVEALIDKVEAEIRKKGKPEISSTAIGDIVMKRMKGLDKVAYIRFASVYREFTDIETFQKELRKLLKA
jgi:transcriptional repressor NrdR